ncbi:hypothetical protein ACFL1A_02085, partial [Patescibacteria group bacterium]
LSFVGLCLATVVVIFWAEKLLKKSRLAIYLPFFFFANPMLIYYAFEVRTYGWYIFFALLSMYAYLEKKWKLLIAASVLGFYTHSYFLFTIFVQVVHYSLVNYHKIFKKFSWKKFLSDRMVKSTLISSILISPWFIKIIYEASKLKSSWYYPVDLHLIKSVLGNMFINYQGTPWYLWKYTAYFSLLLLALFVIAMINPKKRVRNSYFLLNTIVPLVIVIGISFIKPLFVNRYLIPSTISMVFLVVFSLEAIKNKLFRRSLGLLLAASVVIFNMWYPTKHAKLDIRSTISEINSIRTKNDLIYASNSLILFETIYYASNRDGVYLYNPNRSAFPWYVGEAAYSENLSTASLPVYPKKAFIVNKDGSYHVSYQVPLIDSQNK